MSLQRPFVDPYGQNSLENWPSKIKDSSQLKTQLINERKKLSVQTDKVGLSDYGGFLNSQRQKITGHFYTKKIDGKWWFVDPSGYLFWSFGITSVTFNGGKTIEPSLGNIISKGKDLAFSIDRPGRWSPALSNIMRKYGENWREEYPKMTDKRLKSWGLNTYGNWTSWDFYKNKKLPYTVAIHFFET